MISKNPSGSSGRLKRLLFCGAAAVTVGQGCGPDLKPLSAEKWVTMREIVRDGGNLIKPVIQEMAMAADEDQLYGFKGREGRGNFLAGLEQSDEKLQEIVANGRVFSFYDPNYDVVAYFDNHPLADGKDAIAINEAFLVITPLDQPWDSSGDNLERVSYGKMLHEAAHNNGLHSKKVMDFSNQGEDEPGLIDSSLEEANQVMLEENRDPYYLTSDFCEAVEGLFDEGVFGAVKTLEFQLEDERQEVEKNSSNEFYNDSVQSNVENIISAFSSPENWSSWFVEDNNNYGFLKDYLHIPLEERRRIVAESGWYEEFLEEDLQEIIAEARTEFGLSDKEKEIRLPTEIKETLRPPQEQGKSRR
ncbi:MAG: hypothetical protein V1664_02970 [Candidatus Uhrbacteria bacterium]